MSGSLNQKVYEKKIVRFTVSGLKQGELLNRSRGFKMFYCGHTLQKRDDQKRFR